MENQEKFGILRDTKKRIFTTWGEIAIPGGPQDDHTPFERRGNIEINNIVIFAFPNIRMISSRIVLTVFLFL